MNIVLVVGHQPCPLFLEVHQPFWGVEGNIHVAALRHRYLSYIYIRPPINIDLNGSAKYLEVWNGFVEIIQFYQSETMRNLSFQGVEFTNLPLPER